MPPYVIRRNATYYYRRKIPLDLVKIYGKSVITESLSTKELAEAKILANKKSVELDILFESLRATPVSTKVITSTSAKATADQPSTLDFKQRVLDRVSALRLKRQQKTQSGEVEAWVKILRQQQSIFEEFLSTGRDNLEVVNDPDGAEVFVFAVKHLLDGTPLPFNEVYIPSQPQPSTPTEHKKPVNEHSLEQLVYKWADEIKPVKSTVIQTRAVIERFAKSSEKYYPSQVTKKDVVAFKDYELKRGLAASTINSNLSHLKAILGYAVTQDFIQANPAQDVKIKIRKVSNRDERISFTIEQLNVIFNSEIYTASMRPLGGGGEASYWLPIIALFTGARLEEMSQLRKSDIYETPYVDSHNNQRQAWVIDINAEQENNSLKNRNSARIIPVHSTILKLGFLEYLKTIPEGYIFPALNPSKVLNKRSGNWTKWFSRHLRQHLKITDSRVVFHSFRHTFKDFARMAAIEQEIHNAITGHSMGNEGENYGGLYYPLAPLVEAMQKYKVPALKIGNNSL